MNFLKLDMGINFPLFTKARAMVYAIARAF
jgi:hypothetical protein